jgi:hypothetical protein
MDLERGMKKMDWNTFGNDGVDPLACLLGLLKDGSGGAVVMKHLNGDLIGTSNVREIVEGVSLEVIGEVHALVGMSWRVIGGMMNSVLTVPPPDTLPGDFGINL